MEARRLCGRLRYVGPLPEQATKGVHDASAGVPHSAMMCVLKQRSEAIVAVQRSATAVELFRTPVARGVKKTQDAGDAPLQLIGVVDIAPEEGTHITCVSLIRHDAFRATFVTLWVGTSNGTVLVADATVDGRVLFVAQFPNTDGAARLPDSYAVAEDHDAIRFFAPAYASSSQLSNPWIQLGDGVPIGESVDACFVRSIDVVHASGWVVSIHDVHLEVLLAETYPPGSPGTFLDNRSRPRVKLGDLERRDMKWRKSFSFPWVGAAGFAECVRECHVLVPESTRMSSSSVSGQWDVFYCGLSVLVGDPVEQSAAAVLCHAASLKYQRVLFVISGASSSAPALHFYSLSSKPPPQMSSGQVAMAVAGRLTGAALSAVKGLWGGGNSRDSVSQPSARQLISNSALSPSGEVIVEPLRFSHIAVSSCGNYVAMVGLMDRVYVLDTVSGTARFVLKGCRGAQAQWLCCEGACLLAVYHPLRGVVEMYSTRHGGMRLSAHRVKPLMDMVRVDPRTAGGNSHQGAMLWFATAPHDSVTHHALWSLTLQFSVPPTRVGDRAKLTDTHVADDAVSVNIDYQSWQRDGIRKCTIDACEFLLQAWKKRAAVLRATTLPQQGTSGDGGRAASFNRVVNTAAQELFSVYEKAWWPCAVESTDGAPDEDAIDALRLIVLTWKDHVGLSDEYSSQCFLRLKQTERVLVSLLELTNTSSMTVHDTSQAAGSSSLAGDTNPLQQNAWGSSLLSAAGSVLSWQSATSATSRGEHWLCSALKTMRSIAAQPDCALVIANATHTTWEGGSQTTVACPLRTSLWQHVLSVCEKFISTKHDEAAPSATSSRVAQLLSCFDVTSERLALSESFSQIVLQTDVEASGAMLRLAWVCFGGILASEGSYGDGGKAHHYAAALLQHQVKHMATIGITGAVASHVAMRLLLSPLWGYGVTHADHFARVRVIMRHIPASTAAMHIARRCSLAQQDDPFVARWVLLAAKAAAAEDLADRKSCVLWMLRWSALHQLSNFAAVTFPIRPASVSCVSGKGGDVAVVCPLELWDAATTGSEETRQLWCDTVERLCFAGDQLQLLPHRWSADASAVLNDILLLVNNVVGAGDFASRLDALTQAIVTFAGRPIRPQAVGTSYQMQDGLLSFINFSVVFFSASALLQPLRDGIRTQLCLEHDRFVNNALLEGFLEPHRSSSRTMALYYRVMVEVVASCVGALAAVVTGREQLGSVCSAVRPLVTAQDAKLLHPHSFVSVLFPSLPATLRSALRAALAFCDAHVCDADSCLLTLLEVQTVVSTISWCSAHRFSSHSTTGVAQRHPQDMSSFSWSAVFSKPAVAMLDSATVYPHLTAELQAAMEEQRGGARLEFATRAYSRLLLDRISECTLRCKPQSFTLTDFAECVEDATRALTTLAGALQMPDGAAVEISSMWTVAMCLGGWDGMPWTVLDMQPCLERVLRTASHPAACGQVALLFLRRYLYTSIKWYASLEKGLPLDAKEEHAKHSAGSIEVRSAMSMSFQEWLRHKDTPTSALTSGIAVAVDGGIPAAWFYPKPRTDARIDAIFRQVVGERRARELFGALQSVAAWVANALSPADSHNEAPLSACAQEFPVVLRVVAKVILSTQ